MLITNPAHIKGQERQEGSHPATHRRVGAQRPARPACTHQLLSTLKLLARESKKASSSFGPLLVTL